jgi:MFS transporter, PHS family, inorganic phosphate transporter
MKGNVRNVIIAAVSNLSTAYNLSVISIVQVIIENQYCGGPKGCKDDADLAATACLVGAIFGQLTFGYVGDCLGRSRALQLTMAISIFGALISAFAVPLDSSSPKTVFHFLAITRFVLGVGVGGVYPLSATIASESAGSSTSRGRTASIVFSMQGVANLLVPIIALALVQLPNGNGNPDSPDDLGLSWRLMLGLGGIPGILLAPYKAAETREAAKAAATDGAVEVNAVVSDGSSTARMAGAPQKMTLMQALASPRYWGKILGCAGGWFLFDITFYGNQLFQAPVLASIFNVAHNKSAPCQFEPIEGDLSHNRALQMIMIACIALPGYYVSVCFMDSLGRRNIQLQGFFFMTVLFGILGIWFDEMQKRNLAALLLVLYGLTFFFSNFGPNSTTFILPSETFPPEVRTTLNGFSAASGKAGAALGSYFFMPFNRLYGLPNTMLACAAVTLAGLFLTLAFVEDVRRKSGNDVPIRATPAKVTKVSRRRTNSREILIPPRKPLRGRTNSREIFFPPRQPDGLRV